MFERGQISASDEHDLNLHESPHRRGDVTRALFRKQALFPTIFLWQDVFFWNRESKMDWCCFYYFVINSMLSFMEALCWPCLEKSRMCKKDEMHPAQSLTPHSLSAMLQLMPPARPLPLLTASVARFARIQDVGCAHVGFAPYRALRFPKIRCVHLSKWVCWLCASVPKKKLACMRFTNDPCVHPFSESLKTNTWMRRTSYILVFSTGSLQQSNCSIIHPLSMRGYTIDRIYFKQPEP